MIVGRYLYTVTDSELMLSENEWYTVKHGLINIILQVCSIKHGHDFGCMLLSTTYTSGRY